MFCGGLWCFVVWFVVVCGVLWCLVPPEYSLCIQWTAKDPRFLHGDSDDSDQTGQMPRLI